MPKVYRSSAKLRIFFEQPDSVTALLPAFDKLVDVSTLFYCTPKIWDATHIFLFPRHNIMQGDETALANKCRVGGKIGFHALVAMIAVDEKKIERLSGKELPYLGESLRLLGVRAQCVNFLPSLA